MEESLKKQTYEQLKKNLPEASIIEIIQSGSGDAFDDFYSIEVYDKDKKEIKTEHGTIQSLIEDYCFEVFDKSGNPNFNDEGSTGTVKLDLDNYITTLDNYWYVRTEEHSGTEHF